MSNSNDTRQAPAVATAYWTVGPEQGELRQRGTARARPRRGARALALLRHQQGHRNRGAPRPGPGMRGRGHGRPAPGGRLPVAGEVRLPLRRRGRGRPGRTGWARRSSASTRTRTATSSRSESLTEVPDDVPARRAVLTGTVETAVNALWEAGPRLGDRVAVIGAGLVGGMVAKLLRTFPLARLQLIDVDPAKRAFADTLGVDFSHPDDALPDCDIVIHCSASQEGLRTRPAAGGRRGRNHRDVLVRGPQRHPAAGGGLPRPPALHPRQPGGRRGPRPPAPPHQRRPARARRVPAGRPGLRHLPHRRVRASTSCPASSSASPTAAWTRSATSSNTLQPKTTTPATETTR